MMRNRILLFAALLSGVPAFATPAFIQAHATNSANTSATSLTDSLGSSVGAGNLLIATAVSNGTAEIPSSISGCGSWNLAIQTTGSTSGVAAVYYAMNVSGGSCTVTANYTTATGINLIVSEYSGLASTYALEIWQTNGPANCCTALPITTQGANDLLFGVENFGSGSGACTSFPNVSPFNNQPTASICGSPTSGITTGTFDAVEAAGTYTFNPNGNNTFGINTTYIVIAFRATVPTLGREQYTPWVNAASTAFGLPNRSGDLLLALCENDVGTHAPAAPTDTAGNSWIIAPVNLPSDSSNTYDLWFVPSAIAGANTVTCGGSPSGLALWEYTGTNPTNPLGSSSDFFSQNPSTTFASGDVQVNSNSILFSVAALMGTTSQATFSGSSGFAPGVSALTNAAVQDSIQQWDEIGASGSYSNSVTASQNEFFPQVFVLVFESAQVTTPALKQHWRGSAGIGPDGSLTAYLPSNVAAGDLLIQVVANNSGYSPGTPSDSQSNAYTLIEGGGSTQYALYWAIASASGALNSTNTSANCIGLADFSMPSTPTLDQSNSAVNAAATSLGTGSITTSVPGELLVSTGYDISDSYRLYFTSFSPSWSLVGFACGGHYAAAWLAWQPQVAQGAYSNTLTVAQSMPLAAVIASFKFGNFSQPVVQIVAKNRGFQVPDLPIRRE